MRWLGRRRWMMIFMVSIVNLRRICMVLLLFFSPICRVVIRVLLVLLFKRHHAILLLWWNWGQCKSVRTHLIKLRLRCWQRWGWHSVVVGSCRRRVGFVAGAVESAPAPVPVEAAGIRRCHLWWLLLESRTSKYFWYRVNLSIMFIVCRGSLAHKQKPSKDLIYAQIGLDS